MIEVKKEKINDLKGKLSMEFEMKDMSCANKILRIEISRDRLEKKLFPFTKIIFGKGATQIWDA